MSDARIPATHVGILETALLAMASTIRHKDGLISTNPVGFDWDGEFVRLSTLKSRVKYRNLVANPQITFCVVDPQMPTRYIEIRGVAELTDDPEGTVIIRIIPTQVSTPTLYGARLDRRAADIAKSGTPA